MFEFLNKIPAGFRQAVGSSPANEYQAKQQARAIQIAQAERLRQASTAQAAVQGGAVSPEFYSTVDTPPFFNFVINTNGATVAQKIVLGSTSAAETRYKAIDAGWTGNTGALFGDSYSDFLLFQDLLETRTLDCVAFTLRTTPTDQTSSSNADTQLNRDVKIYKFGQTAGELSQHPLKLIATNDPTAFDQLYRYVTLPIKSKRINKYTAWEMMVLPNVSMEVTFVVAQVINAIV